MLPIIGFPGVVEEFADWFSMNLSFHQLRRFKQYLSGLIARAKGVKESAYCCEGVNEGTPRAL